MGRRPMSGVLKASATCPCVGWGAVVIAAIHLHSLTSARPLGHPPTPMLALAQPSGSIARPLPHHVESGTAPKA